MLTEICQYLRNWFVRDKLQGHYVITGGVLTTSDGTALPLLPGQYCRIIGSVFNDGVRQYGYDALVDEPEFIGAVWSMAVPPELVDLDTEITKWIGDNATAINSPYTSESFGGYSYTIRGGGNAQNGEDGGITWQSHFRARLAPWRKI